MMVVKFWSGTPIYYLTMESYAEYADTVIIQIYKTVGVDVDGVSNELGGRRIVLFATLPAHPGRTESPTPNFYWLIKFKIQSSTTGSFFFSFF